MLNNLISQTQTANTKNGSIIKKQFKNVDEQLALISERVDALEAKSTEDLDAATVIDLQATSTSTDSLAATTGNIATLESENTDVTNLTADNANITELNATTASVRDLDAVNLRVQDTLQLDVIQGNQATYSYNKNTRTDTDLLRVGETITASDSGGIHAESVTSDSVTSGSVTAESISADSATVTSVTSDSVTSGEAIIDRGTISDLIANNADIDDAIIQKLRTSEIKYYSKINLHPEQQTIYDWYAIDIPTDLRNFVIHLHADYTGLNDLQHKWNVTIVGTEQVSVICYDEDALEVIKDFSFDPVTGKLRIRFHGTEWLYYGMDYMAENEPVNLEILYDAEALDEIHAPNRLRGYVFQSYNDNTVEFYFGGEVFVHSLAAEFQEFEEQMTKLLYVERNILLPETLNQDESVRTWDEGLDGQYITNRENEFGHLRVKWESPVNNETVTPLYPEQDGAKLITENTLANYNGTASVTDPDTGLPVNQYGITEIGNNATVHGDIEVTNKLEVGETFKSPHIYDGPQLTTAADLADLADGTLYVDSTDNTLYRKTTVDNNVRLDKIAALKNVVWHDKQPVIYDEATDSLKPSDALELSELDIAGDLRVGGDAYVTGTLHYKSEELIESTADFITLRVNNNTSLASGEYSGIAVNNYNGTDSLALATDNDGTLRVGTGAGTSTTYADLYYVPTTGKWYSDSELTTEVTPTGNLSSWESLEKTDDYYHYVNAVFKVYNFSNLEALATRDEETNMTDKALTYWDATDTQLKTIPIPAHNEDTLVAVVTNATTTDIYTDGTNFYNADTTSATEPQGTAGTPTSIGTFTVYNDGFYKKDEGLWYEYSDFSDLTAKALVEDQTIIDALDSSTDTVTISEVEYATEAEVSGYTWAAKGAQSLIFNSMADYNAYVLLNGTPPRGSHLFIRNEENVIIGEDYPVI